MNTDLTIEQIKQLNVVEPYCFESDREEQWYNCGLLHGVEIAKKELIDKACEYLYRLNQAELGQHGRFAQLVNIDAFRKVMEE